MKEYPWLQSREESTIESWDTRYRTDPYGRLKPEEVFILVPTSRLEEAKRILLPIQQSGQNPLVMQLEYNPLCLLLCHIPSNAPSASKLLANAYLPHVMINVDRELFDRSNPEVNRVQCDIYYWEKGINYLIYRYMHILTKHGIKYDIRALERHLTQFDWEKIDKYALELKTLILLKGTSDGLPKTHVESQNWSFG